ncbi:MAG: PIN domain-containing protein [Verrucomicrobia bacterium]|jgi:predicted nucleic acid-binding protein|nr:PIN domain-containing protein [Verrucomicrobiota bacterium]
MRIFIDTDVLLDVYFAREPHLGTSAKLLDWAEKNPGRAAVSWHGLANLHYLSDQGAEDYIKGLLAFCEVPSTGSEEMIKALELGFKDLEDAMQTSAALKFDAQVIVTRNTRDFRKSPIAVTTPQQFFRQG